MKVKIETDSQWIMVTLNGVKICQKFQTDREPGVLCRFCRGTMRCSLRAPRGVVGAASTSRLAAAERRSGNNSCELFIESFFNARLKVLLLQDRCSLITYF